LLFELHPASTMPYTPIDATAKDHQDRPLFVCSTNPSAEVVGDVKVVLVIFAWRRWACTASCWPGGARTASTRCSAACDRRRRMISYELSYAYAGRRAAHRNSLSADDLVNARRDVARVHSAWYVFLQPLGFLIS